MEEDAFIDLELDFDDEECSLPLHLQKSLGITNEEYLTTIKVLEHFQNNADVLQDHFLKSFRKLGIDVFLKSTGGSFYDGSESMDQYSNRSYGYLFLHKVNLHILK